MPKPKVNGLAVGWGSPNPVNSTCPAIPYIKHTFFFFLGFFTSLVSALRPYTTSPFHSTLGFLSHPPQAYARSRGHASSSPPPSRMPASVLPLLHARELCLLLHGPLHASVAAPSSPN